MQFTQRHVFFVLVDMQVLLEDQTLWWKTELLGGEMDGFFGITHRLCVQGKGVGGGI